MTGLVRDNFLDFRGIFGPKSIHMSFHQRRKPEHVIGSCDEKGNLFAASVPLEIPLISIS